jgi:hypothetical protein
MSTQNKIPWRKFGFESVLIIVSILVAFSIEEWRQSRADSARERVLIEALARDFAEAERMLVEAKSHHSRVAASGQKLLEYDGAAGVPVAEREHVDLQVGNHYSRATYLPPMGTVQSILGSGRIDLISNVSLVNALTAWSAEVEALNTTELEARNHFYDQVYPYLAERVSLKDLDKGYRDYYPEFPFEQEPVDAYLLLDDQVFLNIIYTHWVLKTNILTKTRSVEASLARIRDLITESLANE